MKLDKEEILKMSNMILDQYMPFRERIEYSVKQQEMIIASNEGLIKAINVIINNIQSQKKMQKRS